MWAMSEKSTAIPGPRIPLISYATWVIFLHFPSQQDDGSLLLVDYHEIFMASFVCLCKPQKCHNSDPHPAPPQHLSFLFGISVSVLNSSCAIYHILVWNEPLSFPLLNTGISAMLTADWNADLFLHFHTQILRNTYFLCNQHNLHFIKILFHLHKCIWNNTTHPSANVCFLAKASVIPLLSPACYHSLYIQGINVSPLLDAQMQKGNGAIWTEQRITLLFEQHQLSMQGTEQKEFSPPSLLILNLLRTSSTTEITQPFGRKAQGVHGEKTHPSPVGTRYVTAAMRKGDKPYIALGNGITLLIQAAKIHTQTCRRLTVNS